MNGFPVLCAVFDCKSSTFDACHSYINLAQAERAFIAVFESDNIVSRWPDDFSLYHLGCVNPATGELVPLEHPVMVISGQSAVFMLTSRRRCEGSGDPSPITADKPGKDISKESAGASATNSHAAAEGGSTPDLFKEAN